MVIDLFGRAENELRPDKHEKRKRVVSFPNSNSFEVDQRITAVSKNIGKTLTYT